MKRLMIAILALAAAPAFAADPPPAPSFTWSSWTGAGTIRTEGGDVKPMLSARFAVNVALPLGIHVVGRAEAARQQDGGAVDVDFTDPSTFDTLELYGGAYREVVPGIGIAGIYGLAVPFEGGKAKVLERYPQTLFGGARYGTAGGILIYAGVGRHDAAGPGLKGMVTAQVPTGGRSAVVTEIVYPHGFVRTLVLLRLK
jgi:opacity protein-like surface antigen